MRIIDYLSEKGVDFELKHHPEAYTAQEEAAAQHISGHVFAKTVVVRTPDEFVLLVLPASHRVKLGLIGELLGEEARLATERELADLFPDCELGAEPPFGSLYGLQTYVDDDLARQEKIAIRACTHRELALLKYHDYARLERPRVVNFAEPERGHPREPEF